MVLEDKRLTGFSVAIRGKRSTYGLRDPGEFREDVAAVPECLEHDASSSSLLKRRVDSIGGFGLSTPEWPRDELRIGDGSCLGTRDGPESNTKMPTKADIIATATNDKNCMHCAP